MKQNKSPLRTILKATILLITLIVLIHIAHALTLDRIIEYREVTFTSERVPAALEGYRIAFISDIHRMPDEQLEEVVAELNHRALDMLILGGDIRTRDRDMERTMEILAGVQTTDGIYGVEGNHDYYAELFAAMEAHGLVPLSNSGVSVRAGFYLAGVEDLWNRSPNIAEAIAGAEPDDFVLLVSHNPDVTMQEDTSGVDLVLSGHTHGGQITFFGVWAPWFTIRSSITEYGQRFASGWAEARDGTPVYVSNGTAVQYYDWPRVFARPQVILITLERGERT